ncbi:MAG: TVP38/TMEM64 family protein [Clostridia bacterium]|nr:TVP38/TMEM64 family protein [Clostridia bacterium]
MSKNAGKRFEGKLTQREKRFWSALAIGIFLAVSIVLFLVVGRPMLRFMQNPAGFRTWVNGHGAWGRVAFVGMMFFQVVVAFIPGEPLEIAAGYAFGFWEGTLLCLIGAFLGSLVVFLFVRNWGIRVVEVFFPREKILSLKFLRDKKKRDALTFILFIIPGTPKDILTYCAGLTDMPLGTWLLIGTVARLPSVVTSTVGGNALGIQEYWFAILTFGITLAISLFGWLLYRRISAKS